MAPPLHHRQTPRRRRQRRNGSAKAVSGLAAAASSTARPARRSPRRPQTSQLSRSTGRRRRWKTASGTLPLPASIPVSSVAMCMVQPSPSLLPRGAVDLAASTLPLRHDSGGLSFFVSQCCR